jgi:DNA-binding response OmpR family regulator
VTKLLIIEDDRLIIGPMAQALENAGFEVVVSMNGEEGLQAALGSSFDLVVLDIMLPGMDGWEVCKRLRAQSVVPILMLTALGDEVDRVLGLELGADDYLTKPFSRRELIARIRALLRRIELDQRKPTNQLEAQGLVIDLDARRVYKDGQPLNLRYKEFELLSLLVSRAGEVVTRAELFDEVWGTDWLGDTRTLAVHIRWLREKIEEDPGSPRLIQTVRGVGYRFASGGEE